MSTYMADMSPMDKLKILSDAAKYDVACTSSGVGRKGDGKHMGNAYETGICHAFSSDGRCISLLKILMTNECIYDCKYCVNRVSNDVVRTAFTPDEICNLTMEFYRRNYIEGLFLSSGIIKSPDYTMGLIYETLFLLRNKYHFNGYIHIKGIPGASAEVIEMVGYLCDRMSVNLELPTGEGLKALAPNKARANITRPMRMIQSGIQESRAYHGVQSMKSRVVMDERTYYNQLAEIAESKAMLEERQKRLMTYGSMSAAQVGGKMELATQASRVADAAWQFGASEGAITGKSQLSTAYHGGGLANPNRYFVPAGQSTQMIIGATGETDYQIMAVSEAMYNRYDMKRVFYSAFVNANRDEDMPGLVNGEIMRPQLLREHRLYQGDFLLRFYGFQADELLSEKNPNFHELIDPKCNWAVHHLEQFPVEISKADYYTLLRVPGIGTKSAKRIMAARRHANLTFDDLKRMGVVLKRALYFITCGGKMMYQTKMEETYITNHLIYNERPNQMLLSDGTKTSYEQLSLFDMGGVAI